MPNNRHFLIPEDEKDEYLAELVRGLGPTATIIPPPPDSEDAFPEIDFSLERNDRTYVFRVERPVVVDIVRTLQLASKRRWGRRADWRSLLSDEAGGLFAEARLLAERHPEQSHFSLGVESPVT